MVSTPLNLKPETAQEAIETARLLQKAKEQVEAAVRTSNPEP